MGSSPDTRLEWLTDVTGSELRKNMIFFLSSPSPIHDAAVRYLRGCFGELSINLILHRLVQLCTDDFKEGYKALATELLGGTMSKMLESLTLFFRISFSIFDPGIGFSNIDLIRLSGSYWKVFLHVVKSYEDLEFFSRECIKELYRWTFKSCAKIFTFAKKEVSHSYNSWMPLCLQWQKLADTLSEHHPLSTWLTAVVPGSLHLFLKITYNFFEFN
jgi:hypothetical protein